MVTDSSKNNFLVAFRNAKQRKREWEQRMEEKLAALEAEMNVRKTANI